MVRSWVVELRFDSRADRPAVFAIRRELGHLQPELFDAHDSVGLRFDVQARDGPAAVAYVESRLRAVPEVSRQGLRYHLDATGRR